MGQAKETEGASHVDGLVILSSRTLCYAIPMHIPTTSKTLLRTLGENARSARWAEFTARYRPMMEAFLATRFPELVSDTDDIVQETLLALVRILPNYRYSPGENGAFHNYLIGIITHKAHARLRTRKREARRDEAARREAEVMSEAAMMADSPDRICEELDEAEWQKAAFEIALRQLLADDTIQERTKQVFVRVAVHGEAPGDVAKAFGISANTVSQIRFRLTQRLRNTVEALEKAQ